MAPGDSRVPDVVTFGEAMIRLTPPGMQRLEQAHALDLWVAGAELNVAVAIARLGGSAAWVSRLPANPLGRRVAAHARANGVDTTHVRWTGEGRLGLLFVEVGQTPRPSATLYDRSDSAFASLEPAEFDWPELVRGAKALHTSGITPALSPRCAQAAADAMAAARAAGCHTSYDLNFRARLTTPAEARRCVEALAAGIDTLIASTGEVESLFGLTGEPADVATRLRSQVGVERVVVSSRVKCRDGMHVRRSALSEGEVFELQSPPFVTVDPLGSGDAFTAGFLSGLLDQGPCRGLEIAGAVAALKQSIPGDFAIVVPDDVEHLLGGGDGRTRR
jgi:2-dehydro-3-deoxygluconokinase